MTGSDLAAPGWYGKLSTLGDFASRRLAANTVRSLDHWLAGIVDGSRHELGDEWLDRYLASPLQRFVLGPGLVEAADAALWWFGVLMPSCDNVGRYFPLVVLQSRPAPPTERFGLDHLDLWWQRAAEAALETLSDEVDVERFDRALAELPPWPALREVPAWAGAALGSAAGESDLQVAGTLGEVAQALAAADWIARLQGMSLWWSWRPSDGPGGAATCRIVNGLPSAQAFAAMIASPA